MGLGTTFRDVSLDLAIATVPRSQGPLVSERFCGPLAELRQQWDTLLKNLPGRILSSTEFRGLEQIFRNVLCESSLEILCGDLIGVANSASSWEELATFREQVLQWVLAQACSKSLKASASRALRELSGNPNSLSESVQFLAHDIGRHPVRLSLLAGIGAAGFGMRMGRLAGAAWARVRGFGAVGQFVARSSVGLGAELSFFSAGTRAAEVAQGKKLDWSISAIGNEMLSGLCLLGSMKLINPLGHLGRVTGGLRLLQAGTAHFAGASIGTWASALANKQALTSYQIFSGATHLMIEGAIASGLLSTGLPGLEAAHRALDLKTRSMLRQSMRTAWSQAKGFLDRSLKGPFNVGPRQVMATSLNGRASGEINKSRAGEDLAEMTGRGLSFAEGGSIRSLSSKGGAIEDWPDLFRRLGELERQYNNREMFLTMAADELLSWQERGHPQAEQALLSIADEVEVTLGFNIRPIRICQSPTRLRGPSGVSEVDTVFNSTSAIPEEGLLEIFSSERTLIEWIDRLSPQGFNGQEDAFTIAIRKYRYFHEANGHRYADPEIRPASDFDRGTGETKFLVHKLPGKSGHRLVIVKASGLRSAELAYAWLDGQFNYVSQDAFLRELVGVHWGLNARQRTLLRHRDRDKFLGTLSKIKQDEADEVVLLFQALLNKPVKRMAELGITYLPQGETGGLSSIRFIREQDWVKIRDNAPKSKRLSRVFLPLGPHMRGRFKSAEFAEIFSEPPKLKKNLERWWWIQHGRKPFPLDKAGGSIVLTATLIDNGAEYSHPKFLREQDLPKAIAEATSGGKIVFPFFNFHAVADSEGRISFGLKRVEGRGTSRPTMRWYRSVFPEQESDPVIDVIVSRKLAMSGEFQASQPSLSQVDAFAHRMIGDRRHYFDRVSRFLCLIGEEAYSINPNITLWGYKRGERVQGIELSLGDDMPPGLAKRAGPLYSFKPEDKIVIGSKYESGRGGRLGSWRVLDGPSP